MEKQVQTGCFSLLTHPLGSRVSRWIRKADVLEIWGRGALGPGEGTPHTPQHQGDMTEFALLLWLHE